MKKLLFLLLVLATGASAAPSPASHLPNSYQAASAADLSDYVGTYSFADNGTFFKLVVTVQNGKLFGKVDGNDNFEWVKQDAADTFKSTSSYGSVFVFTRDASGKVTGFKMQIMGNDLVGTRDK